MSADEAQVGVRISRFAWVAICAIILIMLSLMAPVARLQMRPDDRLAAAAGARVVTRPVTSMRGDVLDRRDRLIATSRPAYRVIVDPLLFPGEGTKAKPAPTLDQAILRLAEAMHTTPDIVGERVLWAKGINASRVTEVQTSTRGKEEIRAQLIEAVKRRVFGVEREPNGEDRAIHSDGHGTRPPRPLRYLRVGGILPDDAVSNVRSLGIAGVYLERVSVRQIPGTDAGAIVGKVNVEHTGVLGAERLMDAALRGRDGQITYIRDAWGRPLWIEVDQITPEERGRDGRLSIDLEIQRIVREELWRGMEEANAAGGRAVVVDPHTGEVLAMVDLVRHVPGLVEYPWVPNELRRTSVDRAPEMFEARYRTIHQRGSPEENTRTGETPVPPAAGGPPLDPALARNRCVEDVYEPGSTFKSFVWAIILDAGKAKPDEVFDTAGGTWRTRYGRIIKDVTRRRTMTWNEVLVNSSNIGMTQGAERLSFRQLHDAVRSFGFGSSTRLGLPGETAGIVTTSKAWSKYTQTSVSFGHEVAVTPVQMARAFCVFAREGELAGTLPTLTLTARGDAPAHLARPTIVHRTMSPRTAILTRKVLADVLVGVDDKLARRDPPEKGWRYSMFGKSGTAMIPLGKAPEGHRRPMGTRGYYEGQYNSSFIAGAPVDRPRLVMLVVIDDPAPDLVRARRHYGSDVAAPVVRRSVERILPYLGVRPDVDPTATRDRVAGR